MFLKAAANPLYRTPFVAYTNAGVCARSAGRLEQAERYLRQALTAQVDYPETYAQLAGVLHERGSNLQARAFVERYLAVAPPTPDMLLLGHNIELALKDPAAAAGFRDRLRKEFPESDQARAAEELANRNPG
jgi:type IV pilus assembly protein PilF